MSSEKELEAQQELAAQPIHDAPNSAQEAAITDNSLDDDSPFGSIEGEQAPLVKGSETKKAAPKSANIFQLFRYAGALDIIFLIVGVIAAVSHGASLPLSVLFFGQFTNAFIEQQFLQSSCEAISAVLMDNTTSLSMQCQSIFDVVEAFANITGRSVADCDSVLAAGLNSSLECSTVLGLFNITDVQSSFISEVNTLALIFVALGAGVFIVAMTQVFTFQMVAERQVHQIRIRYYKAVLRQNIAWFDAHPTGELANRLSDDVTKILEGIGDKFALLIQQLAQVVAGFVIAFTIEWRLTLFMLAFTPFMIIGGGVLSKLTSSYASKEQTAYASAGAVAEEVLSSVRTVIAFGGERKELERYDAELKDARKLGAKKGFSVGISLAFIFFLLFAVYGAGFWFGGYLVQNRFAMGGDIISAFFSVVIGAFSLGQAGPYIENLVVAAGSAGAIVDTSKRVPPIDSSSNEGVKPDVFDSTIELRNVSFNYPTRPDVKVLDGLSLKVGVGQTMALVGPSGCGKSTVVQLILRFYDVDGGEVLVGGERVDNLNIRWLRDSIGVVSQEPVLFDTTIAENIRYGWENATMEDIEQAAKSANAHDFISQLPDGYNTLTGERGAQLSGGQKQRIAIARALVRNPKILLLDEATSALDTQSESIVQEALDKAREGRTTIVIAHRLSTIQNADVIASVEDGRIAETGTHLELMARKGLYFDLVNAQSYGTDEAFIRGGLSKLYSRTNSQQAYSKALSHKEPEGEVAKQLSTTPKEEAKLTDLTEKEIKELDKDIPTAPLSRLLRENAKEWWLIVIGVLGAAVNGSIFPIYAILFGEILRVFGLPDVDSVLSEVHPFAGLYLVLGVVSGVAILCKVICFTVSGENLTARLRYISFKAMLRQEVGWFDDKRNSSGALTTRLSAEAGLVQGATGSRVGSLVETTVGLLLGLVIAFVYSWLMTLVVLGVVPVIIIAGSLKVKALGAKNAAIKKKLEDAGRISIDSIDNIRTVAALGAEDNFYQQYVSALKAPYRRALYYHPPLYGLIYAFPACLIFFMYAVVFRFGAFLTSQPRDSILFVPFFDVFRVLFALIFGAFSVGQASAFAPNYAKARLAANRIFYLIDREPLIDNYSEEGQQLDKVSGTLAIDSVDFNYPARPEVQVLQGLSVTVKPGQTLALVGPSGCGKSTVVSLIERFYDPLAGALKLEDVDLRDLNLRFLRSQIGIVSQEPVLFDCSIAENIRYGALFREVSDEEIIEAAKAANIHNFIDSLPQGYSTNVGAKGTQLSGGQKQRIAIARALIRDPKILLLDEATSALDTESEKVVQEALDKAREGRTSIVIAHRLSTIYNSDQIAVIKAGKVEEAGTHSELIAAKGLYYKLNRFQMVDESEEDNGEL